MSAQQPSAPDPTIPVLSVEAWRTMDALSTTDCARFIDRVARPEMSASLDTAIAAGCVHRGAYGGRFNMVAKAVASSGSAMIDVGARWLDAFTHPGADVHLMDGLGVADVLNASLRECVAYGDIALPWLRLLIAAGANPFLDENKHSSGRKECALYSAIGFASSAGIVKLFLEKEAAFDENHPIPTLPGAKWNIFVEASEGALDSLYRHEVFKEIESKFAPGYMAPYHELFDSIVRIIGNEKYPVDGPGYTAAAKLIALGATPRDTEKEAAWKTVMSTLMPAKLSTSDGNDVRNVHFSHAILTIDLGDHGKAILRRLATEAGMDVEQHAADGATLLLRAAAQGNLDGVDVMLELGADSGARVAGLHKEHSTKVCDGAEIAESHGYFGISSKIRAHQAKVAIQKVIDRVSPVASSCQ